jgi:hypothetical protein
MAVNKVEVNGETIIDLTSDSVTPETLAEGATAHNAAGEVITGVVKLIDVPDYIIAEAERVAKNTQATRTAKSLVFPVMSDFHLYTGNSSHDNSLISAQYAGMGIKELQKRMHLDFTAYLGDYSWGAADFTAEQVMKDITAVKKTANTDDTEIWCVGNHDLNYGKNRDRLLTLDEIYSYIGANSDGVKPYGDIERGYGYLDFENQKIRVIYLNTCDASDWANTAGASARSEWVSPTQIQWIVDTALNFANKDNVSEWGVVIVAHHPLHYGYACFDNVMKLLEAYKDSKSGSLSCQVNDSTSQTVTYDFTSGEKAEIICNIHGHNHNCGASKISSTSRTGSTAVEPWLWRFCIPQICAGRYNGGYDNFAGNTTAQQNYGEVDENGNPVYWYKETGTAKATSFCVVNIDRKNKKIYAYIFGAGKDRVFSYAEEYIPTEYNIGVSVSNCVGSSNNPTTITEDGTATLTFTANSGYDLPDNITVTGASYTWNNTTGTLTLSVPTADVNVNVTAVAVKPNYNNLIETVGYVPDTYLSSSIGTTSGKTGYGTLNMVSVPAPTSDAEGQAVIYLKNVEATTSDLSNTRFGCYDANGTKITIVSLVGATEGYTQFKINYWVEDGYINKIDLSTYLYNNPNVKQIRFCAKGLDSESIITLNEPID